MLNVEKISIISDTDTGEQFNVVDCSENIQQLVEILNGWIRLEADAHSNLLLIQSALNELSHSIVQTYHKEKQLS